MTKHKQLVPFKPNDVDDIICCGLHGKINRKFDRLPHLDTWLRKSMGCPLLNEGIFSGAALAMINEAYKKIANDVATELYGSPIARAKWIG